MQKHIYDQNQNTALFVKLYWSFGTLKGGQEVRDSSRGFFGADCVAFGPIEPVLLDLFASLMSLVKDDSFGMQQKYGIHQFNENLKRALWKKNAELLIKDANSVLKVSIIWQKEKASYSFGAITLI